MKANELKQLLEKCDANKLKNITALIYKKVPKKTKESLDEEIIALVNNVKIDKHKKEIEDFNDLVKEAEEFIQNAYDGYYFKPNNVVPKKERSLWRFKVMKYIKAIKTINVQDENYDEANELLLKIFDVLSYACGYYTFSTYDPFASIEMVQYDFYELLAGRLLKKSRDNKTLTILIKLATSNLLDRNSLHEDMIHILIEYMTGEEELLNLKALSKEIFMNGGFDVEEQYISIYDYYKERSNNDLLLLTYRISLALKDPISELDYFMENYNDRNKEVGLYVVLDSINYDNSDKDWIDIYDYVTKKYKISARDSLRSEYRTRKRRIDKQSADEQ